MIVQSLMILKLLAKKMKTALGEVRVVNLQFIKEIAHLITLCNILVNKLLAVRQILILDFAWKFNLLLLVLIMILT